MSKAPRNYKREVDLRRIRDKGLFIPTALYDEIKASADYNGRTLDEEVEAELRAYRGSLR